MCYPWIHKQIILYQTLKCKITVCTSTYFRLMQYLGFIYKINALNSRFYNFFYSFYSSQKKTLEINTRHPLIKELKSKIEVSIFAAFIYKFFLFDLKCLGSISTDTEKINSMVYLYRIPVYSVFSINCFLALCKTRDFGCNHLFGLWCLTPLSTISQLYRGSQFY